MTQCQMCQSEKLNLLADFGSQPLCNRFLKNTNDSEEKFSLTLDQCSRCGLIQQIKPAPAIEVRPRFPWITYSEPEGHLDHLAKVLASLPGINRDAVVGAVSFKDDTLLRRLNNLGLPHTWRIDPKKDLNILEEGAGIEMVQEKLDSKQAQQLITQYPKADLLVARHILEHAHSLKNFLDALTTLVRPGGYFMLEVPDCGQAFDHCDYSTVWEEHIVYFTRGLFKNLFSWAGFEIVYFESFPYALEDSLVAVVRRKEKTQSIDDAVVDAEMKRGKKFAQEFKFTSQKWRENLVRYKKTQGPVAVFGAGHLSCTFINLLELQDLVEFVVDDNKNKIGLFMPGSKLFIIPSENLVKRGIKLAILCLSPESEEKVIKSNAAFTESGGKFCSIFPASRYYSESLRF